MNKKVMTIALILIIETFMSHAQTTSEKPKDTNQSVEYLSVYPLFTTKKSNLFITRDFYTKWFNMEVIFESTWFVLLAAPGEGKMYLAFMSEDHPSTPPESPPALTAQSGVCVTLQVADSKREYDRLVGAGAKIYYHLKDEAWGQRRFGLFDPNGMYIDVVQQTEPDEGYWDKYMIK